MAEEKAAQNVEGTKEEEDDEESGEEVLGRVCIWC